MISDAYAVRDRVHLGDDQQQIEDQALEAAHHDRAEGKSTLVIAQTSNEHLRRAERPRPGNPIP